MKLKLPIEKKELQDKAYTCSQACNDIGFNKCLAELEQCEVFMDEDKLRVLLCGFIGEYASVDAERNGTEHKFGKDMSDIPKKHAKSIIASLPEIMSIKKHGNQEMV